MAARILVLNDDPDLVHALGAVLEDAGYEVHVRQTRSLDDVIATKPDLVHFDCPPGATREILNFVQRLRLTKETLTIPIIISVTSRRYLEPDVLREQLIFVLVRPFEIGDLLAAIHDLLEAAGRTRSAADGETEDASHGTRKKH